jgi:hypothetical protein
MNGNILDSANARLLIAIDENYIFPSDFRKYIPKSAASTGANILERILDMSSAQLGKTLNPAPITKYTSEREKTLLREGHIEMTAAQDAREKSKILDINSISMDDIAWANCYLIVAPAYYKMTSPKVRRFTEVIKEACPLNEIRNKVITAMTVAKKGDDNFVEVLKDIYNRFISLGAIIAPAGISSDTHSKFSANPYGYRQIIGEAVHENLIDDQIRRLVTIAGKTNLRPPEAENAFFNVLG